MDDYIKQLKCVMDELKDATVNVAKLIEEEVDLDRTQFGKMPNTVQEVLNGRTRIICEMQETVKAFTSNVRSYRETNKEVKDQVDNHFNTHLWCVCCSVLPFIMSNAFVKRIVTCM